MANVQHKDIVDAQRHEPKGISTALADTVYVADGSGSGEWKEISYTDTVVLADVSTASSVLIPIPVDATIELIRFLLGGAITTADATVTVTRGGDSASLGSTTISFTDSGEGVSFDLAPTSNNVIDASDNGYLKITTDGGSTDTAPLYITIQAKVV